MYNYTCTLVNDQGCIFDTVRVNTINEAKSWARSRGGKYTLKVYDNNTPNDDLVYVYTVTGNRCTLVQETVTSW